MYLIPEINQISLRRWPHATSAKIGGCMMNAGDT